MEKTFLGQIFENNSNCYADTEDESVVMAMDKEQFIKVVYELLQLNNKTELSNNCNIPVVSSTVSKNCTYEHKAFQDGCVMKCDDCFYYK